MFIDETTKNDIISLINEMLDPSSLYEYDGEDENYGCHYCWNHSRPARFGVHYGWDTIIHEDDCLTNKARKILELLKDGDNGQIQTQ